MIRSKSIQFLARFFAPQKNRAFRYKSSDLPMQILWAFRYNPSRAYGLTVAVKAMPTKLRELLPNTTRYTLLRSLIIYV
jgi:hypothetical protein